MGNKYPTSLSLVNMELHQLGFLRKNCRNQGQLMWGASQTEKERKLGDSDPSIDCHLVPDPLDIFLFHFVCFYFQFRPNFL